MKRTLFLRPCWKLAGDTRNIMYPCVSVCGLANAKWPSSHLLFSRRLPLLSPRDSPLRWLSWCQRPPRRSASLMVKGVVEHRKNVKSMFGTVWTPAKVFYTCLEKDMIPILFLMMATIIPNEGWMFSPESWSIGVYIYSYTYSHSQRLVPIHMRMCGINMCI